MDTTSISQGSAAAEPIDVTEMAKKAGILDSVALSQDVWNQLVSSPQQTPVDKRQWLHRLWYVLESLREVIKNAPSGADLVLLSVRAAGDESNPLVELQCICRPGDGGERTLTIMIAERKMSFNQLRERLQSGLQQLLAMLPEGDELVLDCEYCSQTGQPLGLLVPSGSEHDLYLLRAFSNIIEAFRSVGEYPPEQILEIMRDKGGANFILIDATDAFCQQYLD